MDPDDIDLSELEPRVADWISADPDPTTAGELQDLLSRANCDAPDMATGNRDEARLELHDRFTQFLEFGTAGLRGTLGGGPNRMNRAVVIKTAAGLSRYLSEQLPSTDNIRVVIGFDARFGSQRFAADSAGVFTAAGFEVFLFETHVPTPVLAFAVRHLRAEAGIMVTASHNPPQDNGYKVYLGGRLTDDDATGVQIISPADKQIAAHIAATGPARSITRTDGGWNELDSQIVDAYLAALAEHFNPEPITEEVADSRAALRIVYTPLHGVGGGVARVALTSAGFLDLHVVEAQAKPDPEFPTVVFPNPEEPGAMDLALQKAGEVEADLIIANDPDADRCAIAVRAQDGQFQMLHGDQVGALLANYVGAHAQRGSSLASSVVSSRLSERIAAKYELKHVVTLTGFKWIARVPGLVYGYEEALGYCVAPNIVRDKDGISAALALASLVAELRRQGRTVQDVLDDLAREHDMFATDQLSARFVDRGAIVRTVENLLANPPTTLLGSKVTAAKNLEEGFEGLPPTTGLWLRTESNARVVVRPSGTEPKLKCYLEVVVPVPTTASREDVALARERAAHDLGQLKTELASHLGLR